MIFKNNKFDKHISSHPDQLNIWEQKNRSASFLRSVVIAFSVVFFIVCSTFFVSCRPKPANTLIPPSTQPSITAPSPTTHPITPTRDGGTPTSTPKPKIPTASGVPETPTKAPIPTREVGNPGKIKEIKYELYLICRGNEKLSIYADFVDTLRLPDTKHYPGNEISVDADDRKVLWIQVKGEIIWTYTLDVPSIDCFDEEFVGLAIKVTCKSSDYCEQVTLH